MKSNNHWSVRLTLVALLARQQKPTLVTEFVTAEWNPARHAADQHGQEVAPGLAHGTCFQTTAVRCCCSNTLLLLFSSNSSHSSTLCLSQFRHRFWTARRTSPNNAVYGTGLCACLLGKFSFMKMPNFIRQLSRNVCATSTAATRWAILCVRPRVGCLSYNQKIGFFVVDFRHVLEWMARKRRNDIHTNIIFSYFYVV